MTGLVFTAALAAVVRGTCGMHMATGGLCLCVKSLGGEIFACVNTECSDWIKIKNNNTDGNF